MVLPSINRKPKPELADFRRASVPTFHFNVHDGQHAGDIIGAELDGPQTARETAMCFVGDLLVDKAMRSATSGDWELEVTDEEGLLVFRIGIDLTSYQPPPRLFPRKIILPSG